MRRRPIVFFLLIFVGLYAAICAAFFVFQRRLVYFPGPPPRATPTELGIRDVEIHTADGERLHAWFAGERGAHCVVLMCHGNAGNIEDRLDKMQALVEFGAAVLAFDYRGYGKSTGSPTEAGVCADAVAACEHAVEREGFRPSQVIVWGESLGGGVAVELARRKPVGALVLESTFTSLADVGAGLYPWLPVRLLARDRFASIDKIAALDVPILVLHGPDDDIVPFAHGEKLARAAGERATLVRTLGRHNEGGFLLRASDREAVREFLARVR